MLRNFCSVRPSSFISQFPGSCASKSPGERPGRCIEPVDTLAEKRKADRGRIPADFVTAVTNKRTGQRKEGTWGTHVVDFCRCAYFPLGWGGGTRFVQIEKPIWSI